MRGAISSRSSAGSGTNLRSILLRALVVALAVEAAVVTGGLMLAGHWLQRLPATLLGGVGIAALAALATLGVAQVRLRKDAGSAEVWANRTRELERRRRERFAELAGNGNDAVFIRDRDGCMRFANKAAEALLGYNSAELRIVSPFVAVDLADVDRVERFFRDVVLGHPGLTGPIEFRYRTRTGIPHDVEVMFNNLLEDPSVVGVVEIARDIGQRKRLEEDLQRVSYSDGLTGLANRAGMMQRLTALAEHGGELPLAVLLLDVDRFKLVNDALGHSSGDDLLAAIATRLDGCLHQEDYLARLGGDEFTVLLAGANAVTEAGRVAERLLKGLQVPFSVAGREVFATASIGIATGRLADMAAEELLRRADVALHRAKQAGRARWEAYAAGMDESMADDLTLQAELRRALEREEFRVYFQPEIDLSSGAIVGAEALMRWQHPRRGLLAPGQFLAAAEESGFIVAIGRWLLVEACRRAAEWRLAPGTPRPVISVNLSAREFSSSGLVDDVATVLRTTGLDASLLRLEITESTVIEDVDEAGRIMRAVQRLGPRFTIDDFGTGYGSLSYLRRLPFDSIKIDGSFVRDLDGDGKTRAITSAAVAMAHALGMDVAAGGIETAEQLALLEQMACDRGQGFYFSEALPSEQFEHLLAAGIPLGATPLAKTA